MAVIGHFPVLIGLGIDYAIQVHARFDEETRKGSLGDAVFMTVTRTGPAVMYAMLATCMGFLAMFVSPVPMIRSLGSSPSLVSSPATGYRVSVCPRLASC